MRYGIIGDVHERDLVSIGEEFEKLKIEIGICVGDFDSILAVRQIIALQERDKMGWLIVPGNHDHANISHDRILPSSARLQREWDNPANADVREYMRRVLFESSGVKIKRSVAARQILLEDFAGLGKAIIMHGAYGEVAWGDPPDLWNRLDSEHDYLDNFSEMEKRGYKVMIRGHDHAPRYAFRDGRKVFVNEGGVEVSFDLIRGRLHTINPGALESGWFAVVDTKPEGKQNTVLTYKEIGRHIGVKAYAAGIS